MTSPAVSPCSPLTNPFQSSLSNDPLQPEPRIADTAPSCADIENMMNQLSMGNSELHNNEFKPQNYYPGLQEPESAAQPNIFSDDSSGYGSRNSEMQETFEFLIKSLTSANIFVSTLTRDQLDLMRAFRPHKLYDYMQEISRVVSESRSKRGFFKECAFCKNNGENEEHYSSHALKDWRGRVLCPVLRAFNCPRCGATGDRAHTIKYCPYNVEQVSERAGSLLQRRRASHTSLLGGGSATPASSPATATATALNSSPWPNFGNN